jgi:hypothetical protein
VPVRRRAHFLAPAFRRPGRELPTALFQRRHLTQGSHPSDKLPASPATAGLLPADPHTACMMAGREVQMPDELDRKIAEDVVFSAIGRLQPMRSGRVVSSRAALRATILDAIQEAYAIGVLAAEKRHFGELTRPGGANRPAWMDIRLDSPEELAAHEISIQPVVLNSLLDAGFRCLGDLRWLSNRELRQLHYIGIKNAQQLRDVLRRMEHGGT